MSKTPMTPKAAARITIATVKSGGYLGKGTFPQRAISAAVKNTVAAQVGKK
jgi:hypothetical protein